MSERRQTFAVGDRFRIEAVTSSGDITVRPGSAGEVGIRVSGPGADEYQIEQLGDTISIAPPRGVFGRRIGGTDVRLEIPEGGSLDLTTATGEILVQAEVVALAAVTASGDVTAGVVAESCRARCASGDVTVDEVGARLDAETASGEVRARRVGGDFEARTASGDIEVGWCGGAVEVRTASGDLDVRYVDGTEVDVNTVSGDVRLGIPSRRTLEVDIATISGDVRNRLPAGDGSPPEKRVALRVKTLSGNVVLQGT